ncbi:MAG: aminoacyl-tRNA hydrolase [Lachnospiraceae bacterium]|nr:aminoacyl-tRNA hydrolase [Lachnospiraceae bacterium]
MYMIAGLGNPGLKYRHTRHNAGFDALDVMAKEYGIPIKKREKNGITGTGVIGGEKVLLVKPQTFMNNSGECIGALASFYKVEPSHVIVLSDDIQLDYGKLRIRRKGSAGGHNGLKSIIAHLHTEEFPRIRIGVGKMEPGDDQITHVLTRPLKNDRKLMEEAFSNATAAVELLLQGKIDEAMGKYN